ncbi:MAG: hypothetical protein F4228_08880 [Acidobacteria bacterium]|nr:hypothetical protein [Acidobacteriota bacterium]MYF14804.1 hypothetical protein [Acidobacteriota bacterium]
MVDMTPGRGAYGESGSPAESDNSLVRAAWQAGNNGIPELRAADLAQINGCDGAGVSPLAAAAMAGHPEAVEALLDGNADPNLVCGELRPLQAVFFPLLFVTAEKAQAGGADIEIVPPPQAPGVEYGSDPDREHRAEIVERLLASGADPNFSADDFGYPLRLALLSGEARLVEALMNYGADPALPKHLSTSARLSGNGHLLPLLRRRVTRGAR